MAESLGFFGGWSGRRKLGFGAGVVLILLLVGLLGWWAYRTPKAVLFADLAQRDMGVMVAELDKLKQPYTLSDDGQTIFVSADKVHHTRMALMGKQLPLHGVVGFELFNNADFGVSDFVQKVNYQRALQGELTRTILAIDQVQDARVHLALPEQALFRKEGNKAKASVTVSLKGGQVLQANQVAGIQRLVAASVPEVRFDDVTVLDQYGVVLSRVAGEDAVHAAGQLDAKQAVELHLTRKATGLLNQMFGPGEAMVAVDVVLNHQQSKVTTEEVLPAVSPDRSQHPAGVIARERTITKDLAGEPGSNTTGSTQVTTQEFDYQSGRRTEQTVSQGGQVSRLSIAVVVKRALSEPEQVRLRQLLATAVGLQPTRGDAIAIQVMGEVLGSGALREGARLAPSELDVAGPASATNGQGPSLNTVQVSGKQTGVSSASVPASGRLVWVLGALLAVAATVAMLVIVVRGRGRPAAASKPLSSQEREALLKTVEQWLAPSTSRP